MQTSPIWNTFSLKISFAYFACQQCIKIIRQKHSRLKILILFENFSSFEYQPGTCQHFLWKKWRIWILVHVCSHRKALISEYRCRRQETTKSSEPVNVRVNIIRQNRKYLHYFLQPCELKFGIHALNLWDLQIMHNTPPTFYFIFNAFETSGSCFICM